MAQIAVWYETTGPAIDWVWLQFSITACTRDHPRSFTHIAPRSPFGDNLPVNRLRYTVTGAQFFFVFPHPTYFLRLFFLSHSHSCSSRNSDPGSPSRLSSPPPHYGSCLAAYRERRLQLLLPSSTRVEICLPTQGALRS